MQVWPASELALLPLASKCSFAHARSAYCRQSCARTNLASGLLPTPIELAQLVAMGRWDGVHWVCDVGSVVRIAPPLRDPQSSLVVGAVHDRHATPPRLPVHAFTQHTRVWEALESPCWGRTCMHCDHIAHVCTHATYSSARRFTCLHDACCQQDMTLTLRRRACQTHVLLRTGVRFFVQTQGQIELSCVLSEAGNEFDREACCAPCHRPQLGSPAEKR